MSTMSKKTRGPNFSSNEKEILVKLITKHKDIVENKKTDAVTTAMKNEGWRKLTEEFNSISSFCVRNTEQLKTCWDNIKRVTRKDKATTKKQILLTGGGRPDIPPAGPLQGQVEMILGPTLDGLNNPFDSDVQFLHEGGDEQEMEIIDMEIDNCAGPSQPPEPDQHDEENIPPEDVENKMWSSWTPAALKTKVSNTLSTRNPTPSSWLHRRRPKASLQDKILHSKLELIEIMKKNAVREGELKEKLLQEQIKQEIIKTKKMQFELDEKEKDKEDKS